MNTGAQATRRDRVYCEKSQINIYRELAGIGESGRKSAAGANAAPFRSLKEVFLAAACLGMRTGKQIPLKQREDLAMLSYFNDHQDMAVLRSSAIAATGQIEVLGDVNQIVTIAEEYANGGFDELKRAAWGVALPLQRVVELFLGYKSEIPKVPQE